MPSKRESQDVKRVDLTLEESTAIANRLVERLRADVENADRGVENLKRLLSAAQKSREDFSKSVDDVLSENLKRLAGAYDEVGLLKESSTSALLSAVYSKKATREWILAIGYFLLFLAALFSLGVVACRFLIGFEQGTATSCASFAKRIISVLPIYAPLVWFACFSCQRVGMSRRLAETYSHKSLIGATYVGLSQQIKAISESDPGAYNRLRAELISAIVRVYERSPLEDLKGLKTHTPVGEIADAVAKIVGSVQSSAK